MGQNYSNNLRLTVYAALFTALVIVGAYLSVPIPIGPVPIALSDLFVMLAGLILGASWGLSSVGLFIFLGLIGLPVFTGGRSGLAGLFGPTGGFLFGYLACVFSVGWLSNRGKSSIVKDTLALVAGNVLLYAFGIAWLIVAVHLTWEAALASGLLPFIPGVILKVVVAALLARVLRPIFKRSFSDVPANTGE